MLLSDEDGAILVLLSFPLASEQLVVATAHLGLLLQLLLQLPRQLVNHLPGVPELLFHAHSVIIAEHLVKLLGRRALLELAGDLHLVRAVDFEDDGDDDVDKDEDDEHPEADEEYPDELRAFAIVRCRHIDYHEPVVHDHLLEEDDDGGEKVIEVHLVIVGTRI